MNTTSIGQLKTTPKEPENHQSLEKLKQRATSLIPLLQIEAPKTEAQRTLTKQTISLLKDAGLFKLMQPRAFGGYECSFSVLSEIISEIAQGCGSTAWCVSICAAAQYLLALFPDLAQKEVLPTNIIGVVIKNSGHCQRVHNGFRLSGEWNYVSGCDHCDWFIIASMFPDAANKEQLAPIFLLVPRKETIIADTWFSVGLSGTGSKTIRIDKPIFIPKDQTLDTHQIPSHLSFGCSIHSSPVFKIPSLTIMPACLVAPLLGIVSGALTDFIKIVKNRIAKGNRSAGGVAMSQFPQIQSKMAEVSAILDASQLLFQRDIKEVETTIASGKLISADTHCRNRRNQAYIVQTLVRAIDILFAATGSEALQTTCSIQRAWRDAHAIASHITLNWDAVSTIYGQSQLGLDYKMPF
jgi:resorcinol 4-hydroxylase (FADH2)